MMDEVETSQGQQGGVASAGSQGVDLRAFVRQVSDYPVPGVTFLDITPMLGSSEAFRATVSALAQAVASIPCDRVLGIEARGFLIGAPLALILGKGFVPARRPGKLPLATARCDYQLEYGRAAIEIHRDAITPGDAVLIVDDVLATGGTSAAAARLVEEQGGRVTGFAYFIEITPLGGRQRLGPRPVRALFRYENGQLLPAPSGRSQGAP